MSNRRLISRRTFLKQASQTTCAALGLPYMVRASALGKPGITPPSGRITVGAIGIGDQGTRDLKGFLELPDVRIIAVCDVNRQARRRGQKLVNDKYGNSDCHVYHDYRQMLQRKDMDAVSVVTPYHWHSLMGLAAARAGKDIFMEKPIALSLQEGKMLRETVNRYTRVFQLGTQQRSNSSFRLACELVLNGRIGEVHTIKVGTSHGLTTPNQPAMPIPDWLDYDRWVGPASWSPYTENKMQRGFHENISDYSLGMIHCWGIHHLDIAQWGSGNEHTGPAEIEGTGTFPTDGLCDCLLDWDVNMKFTNGVTVNFTDSQKNEHGIRFEGDEGWLFVNRRTLTAEPKSLLKEQIGTDEHRLPVSNNHFQNFLDAVRTRQRPVSPIDVAVRSDTLCHLSYIAVVLGCQLRWDPVQERVIGNDRANQLLATRSMRSPWHL